MLFKDKLKSFRTSRGYTQEDLAAKSGVSLPVIRSYENGLRNPKEENLEKIAEALNVDPWALKDLDIDLTDRRRRTFSPYKHDSNAPVYHFLMLLSEKGLFSIDDVKTYIEYNDHEPKRCISFQSDTALYSFFVEWQRMASNQFTSHEQLEKWKNDLYPLTIDSAIDLQKKTGEKIFTTEEILDLFESTDYSHGYQRKNYYYAYLDALSDGSYTKDDFIRIMKFLDSDTHFKENNTAVEALTSIFAEGSIPQEYLDRTFNDTDQYGATIIQKGVVRYVYEKSKSLTPDETLQVSDSLKMCLETYHRLVSEGLLP